MNTSRILVYGEPLGRLIPVCQALLGQLEDPFDDLGGEALFELDWDDLIPGIRAIERAEAEILLEDANRRNPRELSRDPRLRRLEAVQRIASEVVGVINEPLRLKSHPLIARIPTRLTLV